MASFHVNIYAIVRVKLEGISAADPGQAAKIAETAADLDRLFENVRWCAPDSGPRIAQVEYAGEIFDFLVDEMDAEEVVAEHVVDDKPEPS